MRASIFCAGLLVPLALALGLSAPAVSAEGEASGDRTPVTEWVVSGPAPLPLPAFAEDDGFDPAPLLEHPAFDASSLSPVAGRKAPLGEWQAASSPEGRLTFDVEDGTPAELLAGTRLVADRFVEAKLHVETELGIEVFLAGAELSGESPWTLTLPRGTHELVVRLVAGPNAGAPEAAISLAIEGPERALSWHTSPGRGLALPDIFDAPAVSELELSADGTILAMRKQAPSVPQEGREEWVEFVDTATGRSLRRSAGPMSGFQWAPEGRGYAYIVRDGENGTLRMASFDSGAAVDLLEEVPHLAGFRWTPDGGAIVYSVTTKAEKPDEKETAGHTRVRSLPDRWAGHRDRTHLFLLDLESGARRALTAGELTTALQDVSRDGRRLLFTRARDDREEWPFLETEIWELDLESLEARKVATPLWNARAVYGPEGSRALVFAGPSAFGRVGVTLEGEAIPNEYDGQAYVLDLETVEVDAISRDFAPSIQSGTWRAHDGTIFVTAEDGAHLRLFRYDEGTRSFSAISSAVEVVRGTAFASAAGTVAYRGSSAADPGGVFVLADPSKEGSRLVDPAMAEAIGEIELGSVAPFEFTASSGTRITGRVHLPRDYDPTRERAYPAIVYYYGGTSPVSRDFGGRWPKNWWAEQGYIVYVLQPSGATGFGQEFATRHVNDWGKTTVDEIIEGTEAFLEAHPAVDPGRVGCMGASYGGFMTQLLITHTDMFSAAVSHAGISSIASYWGEGWWGYIYSAIATAKSYPWNAPGIYVGQSALFRADRIRTPLLLLHGSVDTNVPRGESEQLFAALEVLGREVDYVRIEGEDHLIMSYEKRKRWMETIMAFFDRELKGQPEWWKHLYPGWSPDED